MKKIKYSIITTTYNRMASGYLQENIEALQGQKEGNFEYEHIIVDDGSSDDTKTYVEDLSTKDPRIKYHYQTNAGPAKATQRGIAAATGDYVIIVDDDDMLTSESLYDRTAFIETHPEFDWFYGLAEWIDDYGLPTAELFQSKPATDHMYEQQLTTNFIHGGTPTVKIGAIKRVIWPDWIDRSQDYFLWLELLRPEHEHAVGFIDKVVFRYRFHQQSYTSKINDLDKKNAKAALNSKIKSLHPDPLVYLAEDAFAWREEAHKTNEYWKQQMRSKQQRIDELQTALDRYELSRVVKYAIKIRNKMRGAQRRIIRYGKGFIRKCAYYLPTRPTKYIINELEEWPADLPLVSVITPFYNRADTMPETIRSVLGQTFQNFEYIIVDDGSTDDLSRNYIKRIIHPKITVLHQENAGVAAARNNGIAHAHGKYVLCLDSDDILDVTYLEKAMLTLESNPEISIVSYNMKMFGEKEDLFTYPPYNPLAMLKDNYLITASVFRRLGWEATGGFKKEIGYEDWEFWVSMTEKGFFAKVIPETLFYYRTALSSRYVEDLLGHHFNFKFIKDLHPNFKRKVKKKIKEKEGTLNLIKPGDLTKNCNNPTAYRRPDNPRKNVLVAIPWMPFGGAETLIYNMSREIKDSYNLSYVTGLKAKHEWEYKFREISPYIYHLANLFDDESLYVEFLSNYISTRNIDILHIIHCGYVFPLLADIKRRHPNLRVVVTLFNDRVQSYIDGLTASREYIDAVTTDNMATSNSLGKILAKTSTKLRTIPNGIDSQREFSPQTQDRNSERQRLGLGEEDRAIFFVGRLSEEKNPDVFIDVSRSIIEDPLYENAKFFMIGDGPMRELIEHRLEGIDARRIRYLGYQSDIARYLSAADVFVLPSSIEGFPLSILEAMAMEVPVIASNVGAISDIISDSQDGFVVEPGNADQIIDKVRQLLEDPTKLNNMKKQARNKVDRLYSNVLLGDNYKRLYREVIR
jgi:glycosyltransferase involved in cell wall biosynthesis